MAGWPGKYIIGLTGNIATGKSMVRRMLEHLGAYGIDADALVHRAMAEGAPGYAPIVELFGKYILDEDGQINRERLGRIVFSDLNAMAQLEGVVHPLVRQAVDLLVRRSNQQVVVIEAIKLLEGDLRHVCDAIWVTHAGPEVQLARLMRIRKMNEIDARQRIRAQSPQQEKIAAADVIIENNGAVENTWQQVFENWQNTVPGPKVLEVETKSSQATGYHVIKALPRHAEGIAEFVTQVTQGQNKLNRVDVMEAFGEKAFTLLYNKGEIVGLAGWQVENLVARVIDFYADSQLPIEEVAQRIVPEVESASRELQCEASLLFLPPALARTEEVWTSLGYEKRTIDSLVVRAWQDAARESMPEDTELFFHQLRQDRVLRPV